MTTLEKQLIAAIELSFTQPVSEAAKTLKTALAAAQPQGGQEPSREIWECRKCGLPCRVEISARGTPGDLPRKTRFHRRDCPCKEPMLPEWQKIEESRQECQRCREIRKLVADLYKGKGATDQYWARKIDACLHGKPYNPPKQIHAASPPPPYKLGPCEHIKKVLGAKFIRQWKFCPICCKAVPPKGK